MKYRWTGLAAILALAVISVSPAGIAQVNPFGHSPLEVMTKGDVKLMNEAAMPLYTAANPKVGATASWSNPTSGNSGTVELTKVYKWRDLPCRELNNLIKLSSRTNMFELVTDRCEVSPGDWKLRF